MLQCFRMDYLFIRLTFFLAGGVFVATGGTGLLQNQLDSIARDVSITAEVLDNLKNSAVSHTIRITLHNTGSDLVPSSGWSLFFHSTYLLLPTIFPKTLSSVLEIGKVRVSMHGGDLYSFEPVDMFKNIKPNETRVIEVEAAVWSISETDFMPNWYFVSKEAGVNPKIAGSTESLGLEFVKPFDDVRQWKRYTFDRYNPFTPQDRMNRLNVMDSGKIDKPIIPTPKQIDIDDVGPKIVVDNTWKIFKAGGDVDKVVAYASSLLEMQLTNISSPKTVRVSVDQPQTNREGYNLHVDPLEQAITINGKSEAGLFYGIQSLLSLLKTFPNGMHGIEIMDEPRFEYRGMHVDVARNFHTVEDLKRLMEGMAMYKLNKLHLHLSDDEGWRLEIPDLMQLTTVGAYRCHDLLERNCIIPQWGSGPFQNSSGSGYYTTNEYKDLLSYAHERFIEVIPEFDMPGHAHAAIKAMEVRYNTTPGLAAGEEYRLIDPNDTSFYISVQNWMDNAVNPCIESTYNFISKVIDTVVDLHKDIQPLKTYHFGGDEVAVGAWENSSKCIEFLMNNPQYNVSKGLKLYFAERVANLTAERRLGLRGWEDGFMDGNGDPFPLDHMDNKEMSANPWDNIWEWGVSQRAYKFANAGYKVVMSQATDLYFDHPYGPDPKERGLYWATRFTDTRKTFGFLPDSLYDNIDFQRSGKPLTKAEVCGNDMSQCDVLLKPENIIGIQGHLWSETVRTSENFDYMIFPRLLALAERAWYKAEFEENGISSEERRLRENDEWAKFANTLGHKELRRLDELGIQYRIPPPGAKVANGKVEFSVTFPGLTVQYSTDNGTSWVDVDQDVHWGNLTVMHLRTKSENRSSRVVELMQEEHLPWADQDIIDYIGTYLDISAGVVDNLNKDQDNYIVMELKLKNTGISAIHKGTWKLYFTNLYGVAEQKLDCGLRVVHVNGDLYYFTPSISMSDLQPGGQLVCNWHQKWWNTAKTDFFPNWHAWAEGMIPKVIDNTNGTLGYVLPHDSPNKWKRTKQDQYNPYTTEGRYEMHKMTDFGNTRIFIPTPQDIIPNTNDNDVSLHDWVVVGSTEFHNEARYLAEPAEETAEAYILDIHSSTIVVQAEDGAGAFYGSQSLITLFETGGGTVPQWKIIDKPRFKYRGIMIDTARNFKPKEWLFKILDAMAMYKLNTLHLHLSDDEAWRLEIPELPELTEMGANRCQNQDRDVCLIPQRGSGPEKSVPGSGFYTIQDYRDLLQYAVDRHITIVPEIDMPGHSRAAITSMEYRDALIRKLHSQGADVSKMTSYFLTDAMSDGGSKSIQNWHGNVLNPCINSTYDFVSKILDAFISAHSGIQDLTTFHIGGDEVPGGSWNDSHSCKAIYDSFNTTFLKWEFVRRVANIVASKNLDVAAWEDGVYGTKTPNPRKELASRNVFAYAWNNVWEDGNGKRSAQFANEGYKVILAMATHLYLDFPYEPDPEEMGLYWATRYIDTRKIFSFMPDNIFANADVNKMGEPLDMTKLCEMHSCPKTVNTTNVIGMQGSMFSDLIRTEEDMHHSLFPKMLAVAERAWHKASWEDISDKTERDNKRKDDWEQFASKLGHQELPRLEKHNFIYRVPPPGAIIDGDKLKVNTLYPNHDVEMSSDGGKTWSTCKDVTYLPRGKYNIHLRTKSKSAHLYSRVVSIQRDSPTTNGARLIPSYGLSIYLTVLFISTSLCV